ncbi:MAG TPA: hypothetical protein VJ886_07015 [Roseovarius sp.]|nr:hypothetical protein [Roseovarius sp.]
MPRRLIYLPVLGLVAAVLVLGLVLGGRAATTTETEVIDRVADRYVTETGAARSDCAAQPAASAGLWLVVACAGHEYFVDGFGRVIDVTRPGAAS